MNLGHAGFARNWFQATSIIVEKCRCGCEHIKVHLLDDKDVIRATASTCPGDLAMLVKAAESGVTPPDLRAN